MTRIALKSDERDQTERRVLALLDAQAEADGYPFVAENLAFEAWDGADFLGGLTARIVHDWMFVALLAVAPKARGRGVGRDLLRRAEDCARGKGAVGVWLDTYSFQAPGFYERMGYSRFASLPDYPADQARHFYARRLVD